METLAFWQPFVEQIMTFIIPAIAGLIYVYINEVKLRSRVKTIAYEIEIESMLKDAIPDDEKRAKIIQQIKDERFLTTIANVEKMAFNALETAKEKITNIKSESNKTIRPKSDNEIKIDTDSKV